MVPASARTTTQATCRFASRRTELAPAETSGASGAALRALSSSIEVAQSIAVAVLIFPNQFLVFLLSARAERRRAPSGLRLSTRSPERVLRRLRLASSFSRPGPNFGPGRRICKREIPVRSFVALMPVANRRETSSDCLAGASLLALKRHARTSTQAPLPECSF